MQISLNSISENDFEELAALFREFAEFEKLPHKMTNWQGKKIATE